MADRNALEISANTLIISPRGLDRIWGVRKRIEIPLTSIANVSVESNAHRIPTGWRGPGLGLPWKLSGTFHPNRERHYWNFSSAFGSPEVLSIRLDGTQHFHQIHLSVSDPAKWCQRINAALVSPSNA